jgi:hypothetical protein
VKNYYEILSVESTAAPAEIKRAFREEIARYHPDKVQHLGKELQEVAATRATELTEAYRTLTNHELRAEYDRRLQGLRSGTVVERPPATPASGAVPAGSWSTSTSSSRLQPSLSGRSAQQFSEDRSHKDVFVRQATLGRVRQVAGAALGRVSEMPVRGFDLVLATAKMRLFGKGQLAPRFFVRLVRDVNPGAIRETFAMALKARGAEANEVCVLLLGTVTSQTEASQEAAALRNQPGKAVKSLFLIPVDLRDWTARLSPETPRVWRSIVENLQKAS